MLDSERTIKGKVTLDSFSKFRWRQQLFAAKQFCMEKRLSNILKTTNIMKLTKTILKSSCLVLQVKTLNNLSIF